MLECNVFIELSMTDVFKFNLVTTAFISITDPLFELQLLFTIHEYRIQNIA